MAKDTKKNSFFISKNKMLFLDMKNENFRLKKELSWEMFSNVKNIIMQKWLQEKYQEATTPEATQMKRIQANSQNKNRMVQILHNWNPHRTDHVEIFHSERNSVT